MEGWDGRDSGGGGVGGDRCNKNVPVLIFNTNRHTSMSKHVIIQTYFSIPGVYLGEGENPPPLSQNCKNISPWFPTILILTCT